MESSQNGNSSEFRLRCKRILLTYSQVGPDFDTQSAVRLFSRLGARGVLAREQHRDGGIHYHAFILFDTTHHTRNAAEFDVGGAHPNIKAIRWTPQRAYDYVRKDGDIIWNNLDESDLDGSQSTSGRHWADIISSPDKTSFYDAIKHWIQELLYVVSPASRNTPIGRTVSLPNRTIARPPGLTEISPSGLNSRNGTRRMSEEEIYSEAAGEDPAPPLTSSQGEPSQRHPPA